MTAKIELHDEYIVYIPLEWFIPLVPIKLVDILRQSHMRQNMGYAEHNESLLSSIEDESLDDYDIDLIAALTNTLTGARYDKEH